MTHDLVGTEKSWLHKLPKTNLSSCQMNWKTVPQLWTYNYRKPISKVAVVLPDDTSLPVSRMQLTTTLIGHQLAVYMYCTCGVCFTEWKWKWLWVWRWWYSAMHTDSAGPTTIRWLCRSCLVSRFVTYSIKLFAHGWKLRMSLDSFVWDQNWKWLPSALLSLNRMLPLFGRSSLNVVCV